MTPDELELIRHDHRGCRPNDFCDAHDLLTHIDELTRQLDDARDLAIRSAAFTGLEGDVSEYTHALNDDLCETCGDPILEEMGYCGRCNMFPTPPTAQ